MDAAREREMRGRVIDEMKQTDEAMFACRLNRRAAISYYY
jgi:hypothetical protein